MVRLIIGWTLSRWLILFFRKSTLADPKGGEVVQELRSCIKTSQSLKLTISKMKQVHCQEEMYQVSTKNKKRRQYSKHMRQVSQLLNGTKKILLGTCSHDIPLGYIMLAYHDSLPIIVRWLQKIHGTRWYFDWPRLTRFTQMDPHGTWLIPISLI